MVVSSPSATALKAIAEKFTAETGVVVEFVEQPYDQVTSKVLLAAESGSQEYDIVQYDNAFLPELAEGDALAALDDRLASSTAYDSADFSDQVREYAQYQGVSYGLPLSTEPYIVWYRTDLFEKLSLKPAATFDEYEANAKALSDAGSFGSAMGYGSAIGGYHWWQQAAMFGVELVDPATCKVNIDTPEFRTATQRMLDLVPFTPDSAINGGGDEVNAVFSQKDVGQQVNATGYYSILADPDQSQVAGKIDATLAPKGSPSGKTLLFGWLIGVAKNSANPDAAWAFLERALGTEGVRELIAAGGPPPGRVSLLQDPAITEQLPYMPTLIEAAGNSYHLPYIPEVPQIINALSPALNQLATGGAMIDDVMPQLQKDVEEILKGRTSCGA